MAIARQTTAKSVKPLEGAIVQRYEAGAVVAAGEIVSMSADGFVDPADTTSAAAIVVGVAINAAAAAGEIIDVVTHGRITAITGGTPGSVLHASDTAGEPAESAGSFAGVTGFVEAATIAFVRPEVA